MIPCLDLVRSRCERPSEAVRWACILEASAPKAGNVFPGNDFDDLCFGDFVQAAEIAASAFGDPSLSFSQRVLSVCRNVRDAIGTNVNLGIMLLLGPLVEADAATDQGRLDRNELQHRVRQVLSQLDADDSSKLYEAINVAAPGGMGKAEQMDLSAAAPESFLDAMRAASSRDRIARNYADGFDDLFRSVVPVLRESLVREGDCLKGIARAHLRLLADEPDSLIARKFGSVVAADVQQRAYFDHDDLERCRAYDRFLRAGATDLRSEHAKLNPGTTADLIAAGLYALIRERIE